MEKRLSTTTDPKESPPATFNLALCLCGSDFEDTENENERSALALPAISISPILLRRFAPVTRYFALHNPGADTSPRQIVAQVEEGDVIVEKPIVRETDVADEKYPVEEKLAVEEKDVVKERMVVNKRHTVTEKMVATGNTNPFLRTSAMVYGIVEQPGKKSSQVASEPPNEDIELYQYGKLQEDEIRVIVLEPGTRFFDEVIIRLVVRKRADLTPHEKPYEAVSYVWGALRQPGTLKVRDHAGSLQTLAVGSKVVTMLRYLRGRRPLRPLWIDAICINQNCLLEKKSQVQRMREVYQGAVQTLVWMEHDNPSPSIGQQRVQQLVDGQDFDGKILSNLQDAWSDWQDINMLKKNVEPLLKNVYFTRRWIIQELFFSNNVILLDRHKEVDFKILADASEVILRHVHHLRHVGKPEDKENPSVEHDKHHLELTVDDKRMLNALHLMHILRELQFQSAEDHDFMRLLVSTHLSACEKGLDRIYALGAFEKAARKINYEMSVEMLFKDFAKAEFERSLETLYCSGAFPDSYEQLSEDPEGFPLPSWVPDWRSERAWIPISLMHGQHVNQTSFGSTLRIFLKPGNETKFNIIDSMLVLHGAVIARIERSHGIDTIGGLFTFYNGPNAETDNNITRMIKTLTLDSVEDGKLAKLWLQQYRSSNGRDCPLRDHDSRCGHVDSANLYECNVLRRIEDVLNGRRAFVTDNGHWGVGPEQSRDGDCVVRLDGCRFAFVMRQQANHTWKILGDCYSADDAEHAREYDLTQVIKIL